MPCGARLSIGTKMSFVATGSSTAAIGASAFTEIVVQDACGDNFKQYQVLDQCIVVVCARY